MPEPNRVKWVGVRPTNPEESIPIKAGSEGAIDIDIAEQTLSAMMVRKRRFLTTRQLYSLIPAGGEETPVNLLSLASNEQIRVGVHCGAAGKLTIQQYDDWNNLIAESETSRADAGPLAMIVDLIGTKISVVIKNTDTAEASYSVEVYTI